MDFKLKRFLFEADGIFSKMYDKDDNLLATCLDHAYDSGLGNGTFIPKIPDGVYKCVRGLHRLEHMNEDFETFEITGVTDHTNILFHWGNYNRDSSGCILLGSGMSRINGSNMLIHSRDAFNKFMQMQKEINEFTLTITSEK